MQAACGFDIAAGLSGCGVVPWPGRASTKHGMPAKGRNGERQIALCPGLAADADQAEQDPGDDCACDVREEIVQTGIAVGNDELEQFNAAADARRQEQDDHQRQSQAPAQKQRENKGGRHVECLVHGRHGQEAQIRAGQGRVCRHGCHGDEGEAEGFLK